MLFEYLCKRILRYPKQIVSDGKSTITYKELVELSISMARKLDKSKYALLCKSELNTTIGLLACICANRTAIPLSYKYGDNHNNKLIEFMRPEGIITDSDIFETNYTENNFETKEIAVIMCSSGTTGTPKGIMLSENNLLSNLMDIEKYMLISNYDNMLISRPIFHCAVLTSELLFGLTKGCNIYFSTNGINPIAMLETINNYKITVTSGTPTIFYYLSKFINSKKKTCNLQTIAISGECMTKTVAAEIIKALPNAKKFHVYGLTEASPRVSYLPYELFEKYPTSVGVPLDSINIRIVDGELQVKAPSVMYGYYKNEILTHNTIVDGWLHTGDIAEIRDGLLYIKCRKDNMIIRAGMNIYPQEIENVLKYENGIDDVLVYSEKNEYLGERIFIKVVSDSLSVNDVFEICRKKLPSYQYPDAIKIVDKLNYTQSGKLIRR